MTRFLIATGAIFLMVGAVCLSARQAGHQVSQEPADQAGAAPVYAAGKLMRPTKLSSRVWVFLSSGLGRMSYSAATGGPELFTNTFVPQWAYAAFLASARWPEKTMFVLEERASENKGSINKSGHFQTDLRGLAVEVKDEARFADRWAYFSFGGDAQTAMAMTGAQGHVLAVP